MEFYTELSDLIITNQSVALNPKNGNLYSLNHIAKFILTSLKENKTKEEIIDIIIKNFDVKREVAEIDYDDFAVQLLMYGLI
jgi:methyltransferase-like protein